MNSKLAKKLRKIAEYKPSSSLVEYEEGHRDSIWMHLPRKKNEFGREIAQIDWQRFFKLHRQFSPPVKYRGTKKDYFTKEVRALKGVPAKLKKNTSKELYRMLKKEYSVA